MSATGPGEDPGAERPDAGPPDREPSPAPGEPRGEGPKEPAARRRGRRRREEPVPPAADGLWAQEAEATQAATPDAASTAPEPDAGARGDQADKLLVAVGPGWTGHGATPRAEVAEGGLPILGLDEPGVVDEEPPVEAVEVVPKAFTGTSLEGFVRRSVTVEVPATTANLGAGYDTLAMALQITNRVTVEALDEPIVELSVTGEGSDVLRADRQNRFVVALETGVRWALGEVPMGLGWRISMTNAIPLWRGLGSSAAATVAGLVAADALTGGRLDPRRQLGLACEIEGHPDNASAALLGGFVVAAVVDGWPEAIRFDVPSSLRAVLFIPQRGMATSMMRAALPHDVPHRDAAFNVARAALGVAGLASGRYEYLRIATEDRLHEPYRAVAYPELPRLVRVARDAGALGACLSGAGSTVIAFGDLPSQLDAIRDAFLTAADDMGLPGQAQIVAPRNAGAVVVEES